MAHRPAIKAHRLPEALHPLEQRLLAAILILLFAIAAVYALMQLQTMIADIKRVDARLQTLSVVSRQLEETNRSLRLTNLLLAETNAKLDATNSKLNRTNADIKTLTTIRSDIHEMAHKLSGSFLFRGVK